MSVVKFETYCIKITRQDGVVLGITELDKDIVFDSVTYLSAAGYTGTETQSTSDLSVNNADVEGVLTAVGVQRDDIVAGLYDKADILVFIYDWESDTKVRDLAAGSWGEAQLVNNAYKAEFRSLSQAFQQSIGRSHSAECDANFGDARCGLNRATYTVSGSITGATSNSVFTDSALIGSQSDDYYNYGNLTFTSGLNVGQSQEIKDYDDATGTFTTLLPFPYDIANSDAFDVYAGCDKQHATCKDKFNNIINFRGFPHIPGRDEMIKVGGQ